MADQAEAYRDKRRPEQRTCDRVQHFSSDHNAEDRPQCKQEGASANRHHHNSGEEALGGHAIHERAGGDLQCQTRDRPDRQNDTRCQAASTRPMSDRRQRKGPTPSGYQQRKKQTSRGREGYAATSVAFCRVRKRLRLPGPIKKETPRPKTAYGCNSHSPPRRLRANIREAAPSAVPTATAFVGFEDNDQKSCGVHIVLLSDKRDRNKTTYSCLTKIVFCCAHSEQLNMRCS